MIAGLLLANREADAMSGELIATLPFAGVTLIEHQARQLIALGATQIVIVSAQPTPALLGAIGRIVRRVTVDQVSGAGEAARALHPLANVVMLADGIVAGDALLAGVTGEGGEIVVAAADDGSGRHERLGGGLLWAGAARVSAARVAELAALPSDYDPQSALVRAAAQAGARTVQVPIAASIALNPVGLAGHEAAQLIVAGLDARPNWFARRVTRPIAGLIVRALSSRPVPSPAVVALPPLLGFAGIAIVASGSPRVGVLLALAAAILAPIGAAMLAFRGEERARLLLEGMRLAVPTLTVLALGVTTSDLPVALALVAIAILGERAGAAERWWSGDPGGYLVVVALGTLASMPRAGVALAAIYAFATVLARIETLRIRA